MPRAFLSYSSKDFGYVDVIANRLGKINIAFDRMTFEGGKKTIDEIFLELERSDIFVFFISETSLNSKWVKSEINKAVDLFVEGNIKKFLPIIIDAKIKFTDDRIPEWMREEFNLQFISRPSKAAERLKQQLRIIAWELYPKNKELDQLFIGRSELINAFEERIFNFEISVPVAIIASGFPSIGRRKFLSHSLKNANKIRDYYKPPYIYLGNRDSIENFIINLYDLGYSDKIDLSNLRLMSIKDKIKLAINLTKDLKSSDNILFIEDNYCIVGREGKIASWYKLILRNYEDNNAIIFCVISRNKIKPTSILHEDFVFSLHVPGLEKKERISLFHACLDIEKLDLSISDFKVISELFSGFPGEIFFAINLLKSMGIDELLNYLNLIVDYNSEHISKIINEYQNNKQANDLLRLLALYDFISLDVIESVIGKTFNEYKDIIIEFSFKGIIEFIGVTREYFKLNDSIRDFIQRTFSGIPNEFKINLREHTKNVISNYEEVIDRDISDYINSMQFALMNEMDIPEHLLIPSQFLNTMRELYNTKRQYDNVIRLADRVLENKSCLADEIVIEIRYWLCLALARKKDSRIFTEVHKITGPDHDFLLGFYYRLNKNYTSAIERLVKVLKNSPNFYRAKRELVQVYINLEKYEEAYYLAKDNYEGDKNNSFHLQSYFKCLINRDMVSDKKNDLLESLLGNLEKIPSEKAQEMHKTSKAQFEAYIKNNKKQALWVIDEAISMYKQNIYPRLTKIDICLKFHDIEELQKTIDDINLEFDKKSDIRNRLGYLIGLAKLQAFQGQIEIAQSILSTKISGFFPDEVVLRVENELKQIAK
jgi:TIR domain-containing protein